MKHILIFKPHKDSLNIMDITVMGNMYANIISTLKMWLVIIFVYLLRLRKKKQGVEYLMLRRYMFWNMGWRV